MNIHGPKLTLFLIILFSFGCQNKKPEPSDSTPTSSAHLQGPQYPLVLNTSKNVTDIEKSIIQKMVKEWNQKSPRSKELLTFTDQTGPLPLYENPNDYLDSFYGIYKLSLWPKEFYAGDFPIAITQVFTREENGKKIIIHGDIFLNNEHYDFNPSNPLSHDFASVILHEMGHLLGLHHPTGFAEVHSVMDAHLPQGSKRQELTSTDILQLENVIDEKNISPPLTRTIWALFPENQGGDGEGSSRDGGTFSQ